MKYTKEMRDEEKERRGGEGGARGKCGGERSGDMRGGGRHETWKRGQDALAHLLDSGSLLCVLKQKLCAKADIIKYHAALPVAEISNMDS